MKEIEMDGQSTHTTDLTVYTASKGSSTVRLECYGHPILIYISENSKTDAHKYDISTLLALRFALNKWYETEFRNEK